MLTRLHVHYDAADFPEEFLAHEVEVVVLFFQVAIYHDHIGEALRYITPCEGVAQHCEWRKKTMHISGFVFLEHLFRRGLAQVQAAKKVLVTGRCHVVRFVFLHVLDVGLSQRMQALDVIDEGMLPLDHTVHHTIEGDGREDREIGVLRDAVIAVDAY